MTAFAPFGGGCSPDIEIALEMRDAGCLICTWRDLLTIVIEAGKGMPGGAEAQSSRAKGCIPERIDSQPVSMTTMSPLPEDGARATR